jgi:hypothetical protein
VLQTSEILARLAAHQSGDRVSALEILARLRVRAFGVFLILFAAPNALPMPPGFAPFTAIFILLVAVQLAMGRTALWIPKWLGYKSVPTRQLVRVIDWIVPKLARIERWSKPRAVRLTRLRARQPIGVVIIILALILVMPIPIIGNTPPAIAITLMGFGMLQRDGVWLAAGVIVGLVDIAVIVALGFGLIRTVPDFIPIGWWPF